MSTDDQNMLLLHAMIQVFQPNRTDCDRLAEAMGNGVTGNALRQRIAKLRNKNPINSSGAATPASNTAKKGGGAKKKRNAVSKLEYGEDTDYGATPSKKGRVRGGAGARGRKQVRYDDNDNDDDDDDGNHAESEAEELKSGASARAAKKAKTMGKNVKQKQQVSEAEEEDELKIEHEELAGDAGDVGVVSANTLMGGMAFGALDDEPLLGQGSFFYLQDEDEEVV
ncbi:uncharacterized protein LTHEOB_8342 [Lasiodiplodia theobromae]|uniref:uncharacterized protein n=1 Tax=Lasiodiplodia theobromae TaxID=45133 RepID=UPI0015C2DAB0|nr:uncharacterized protein LTHEOB_8342 [Lasiodiplodia theobromae]KAF4541761.1 hypothetical protein LTHEOB_8342 [Lasiodiplodia theobromae]